MSGTKKYWNSIQHLEGDKEFVESSGKEFAEYVPVEEFLSDTSLSNTSTSRRDFLKFLGFSVSAATLAACETPVTKAVPYVTKPEEVTPGVPNYYASTYYDGNDYASILVKTREGRPIYIKGNEKSKVSLGSVNARINSSLLSLYDSKRIKSPMKGATSISWEMADNEISEKLRSTVASGKKVVLLTSSLISPSTQSLIADFKKKLGSNANIEGEAEFVKHVSYDAVSNSGLLRANLDTFGTAVAPSYFFNRAKVVVSLGADFLCNWLMSNTYSVQYAEVRKPEGKWMTKHYQFETGLSLTGSNADVRVPIKPSDSGKVAVLIYNEIAKKAGAPLLKAPSIQQDSEWVTSSAKKAATELWNNKGESLLVAGSNDKNVQIVINAINNLLGNYGKTIDINKPCYIKSGQDQQFKTLVSEMNNGDIGAILMYNVDPVYSAHFWNFQDALSKVKTKVSFASHIDLTSQLCDYICPSHHYLESWDDANPVAGEYSTIQPVIRPIYNTRQYQDSLLKWSGSKVTYYDYMKGLWEKYGYPTSGSSSFTAYWNKVLHDGVDGGETNVPFEMESKSYTLSDQAIAMAGDSIYGTKGGDWELELYVKTGIGDGRHADNPWLQELPDPVSKVVWDNYITMNPEDMKEKGFNTNIQQKSPASVAKVTSNNVSITLPVFPIPGQKRNTIGIALGYGKAVVGDQLVGHSAYPFLTESKNGDVVYHNTSISIEGTGETYLMASSQTHHTIMDVDPKDPEKGRKIVNETTIDKFKQGKEVYNPQPKLSDAYGNKKTTKELDLWEAHNYDTFGHRWGMAIDLNTCFGCSACVTACHSENNVPTVGKDEVRRNRDMFWLRIDRYFSSNMNEQKAEEQGLGSWEMYSEMEKPAEYPQVVFQPVMCQHCNHAPCETVCPVVATTHSNEGLNQMTYNRCVGTRYCANNCPYKVRRFNWFQYDSYKKFTGINPAQDEIGRLVLNPDVTVRSRGVMEKCSMCVQRIQAGKLEAKKKGEKVQDGAVKTACQEACPTNAITFGDLNDNASNVRKQFGNDRAYFLLEEVGTQPNVKYLTKVRNLTESEA